MAFSDGSSVADQIRQLVKDREERKIDVPAMINLTILPKIRQLADEGQTVYTFSSKEYFQDHEEFKLRFFKDPLTLNHPFVIELKKVLTSRAYGFKVKDIVDENDSQRWRGIEISL